MTMWELEGEDENNRLVRMVKETDWSKDDKTIICMAISGQTMRKVMHKLDKKKVK